MVVQYVTYLCLLVFVVFCGLRFLRFARMPIHLRWELYPVPHEKGKEYGGSYFEEVDWWTKPHKRDVLGPLKFMIPEIFLLRALYHENRPLWRASFPFHIGLYLYSGWVVLLFLGAALGMAMDGSALASLVGKIAVLVGPAAFVIGALGTLGLLYQRLTDEKLKHFTASKDLFNLLLILALFVTGLLAWIGDGDLGFGSSFAFMAGLLSFSAVELNNVMATVHILVLCSFMAYFPFTHMTHAFTKYFLWDKVRWADQPNLRGSKIEAQVRGVLSYPVTWRAPHVRGEGRSWAEVASDTGE